MRFRNFASAAGAAVLVFASSALLLAAPVTAKTANQSQEGLRLLHDIHVDAMQIQTAARHLESLTSTPSPKWLQFDEQWNEIKPPVEDMDIRIARLEKIQSSLSPAQRADLDQSKMLANQIRTRTRELRNLLDKPGVSTSDKMFRTYARDLTSESNKLAKTS